MQLDCNAHTGLALALGRWDTVGSYTEILKLDTAAHIIDSTELAHAIITHH